MDEYIDNNETSENGGGARLEDATRMELHWLTKVTRIALHRDDVLECITGNNRACPLAINIKDQFETNEIFSSCFFIDA